MKLNESSGTPWLSAKKNPECEGKTITFKNEGQWIQSTMYKYDDGNPVNQLVFTVDYEGEDRQMTLIKPSRVAMIEAFGDDTAAWVGQKARIALALNTKGGKSMMLTPIVSEGTAKTESVDLDTEGNGEMDLPF